MIDVLIALTIGIVVGQLGRKVRWLSKAASLLTQWGVIALLFFMGISIGGDPEVMRNLPILGTQAFGLALGGCVGAFLLCLPLSLWLKRTTPDEEEPSPKEVAK